MEINVADQIIMKKINEIKPYIRNPRKNDKTVELLCKVIPKVGFNVPLVIDEKGIIVKGHARFTAAIRLGMKELPCIITHADEEAIKADRIADNKISEFSEWINEELSHELDMIDFDFDFSELGFPTVKFDDVPMPKFDMSESLHESQTSEMSENERRRLYEEFLEQQARDAAPSVQIATEKQIERAKESQAHMATPPVKYYKCVCEKCGYVMFVRADTMWDAENGITS